MTELLGLPYSPWTEKARWALDVRRVPYTFRYYQPLLGEPELRLKLRQIGGRVSVPVLLTDEGGAIADSMHIARWADARGEGPRLFPEALAAAIERFVALSERGTAAGRGLSLPRLLADDEALDELLPKKLRSSLGPLGKQVAAFGVRRTVRKYAADQAGADEHRRTLLEVLDKIRAALAEAPAPAGDAPRTILGRFTFADIAAAQVLVSIEPPAKGLKLAPGSRRSFSDPSLREPYADLVAWRDDLYRALR
jgi:glutathione S-transferase